MSHATTTPVRRSLMALACAVAMLVLMPVTAVGESTAKEVSTILNRCNGQENGSIDGFKMSAYAKALKELQTVSIEYSPCEGEIREAELARASGIGGGRAGAAGVAPPTPAEQQALTSARLGTAPAPMGNGLVQPGVVRVKIPGALISLPTPLLALLALLLAVATVLGCDALRRTLGSRRP